MRLFAIAAFFVAACGQQRPAQRVTLPAAPQPGPWQVMRYALDGCARDFGVAGESNVRIELDRYGKVIAVDSGYGDGFSSCVGRALYSTRYRDYADRALEIAFTPFQEPK